MAGAARRRGIFYDGPLTLGLVPAEYRFERMKELMHGSDFAKMLGVENVATHAGFFAGDACE